MITFVDLDGVLSNFDKHIELNNWRGDDGEVRWDIVDKNFFSQLEKMPDSDELMDYLRSSDTRVLTALPNEVLIPKARINKIRWVKEHFNIFPWEIYTVYRSEKQLFAVGDFLQPNILIDDNDINISEWTKRGGIGIKHTSAQTTIEELQHLGF